SALGTRYDIVTVGGRVAGSSSAIGLAKAGYQVLLVERQAMPSDTLSTHVLWPDGIAALDRLGVLERVLATGAPKAHGFRLCHGEDSIATQLIPLDGYDYLLCVRRQYLDGILWEVAANTPGVTALDRTNVSGIRERDGQVIGVEIGDHSVDADLVIGADGRGSIVARSASAVERDIVPAGRYWYYGYFAGATPPDPAELTESDTETDMVGAIPTNDGLLMVVYSAYDEDFAAFRANHEAHYLARIHAHPWIARMLDGATLAAPVRGISGVRGYFRTSHGPGWALIGDALHQKDPLVARGINDALLEAEWLAEALRNGITSDALDTYGTITYAGTRSKALNARMLSRPDRYMTEEQGAKLSRELTTPEGLAGFLLLEYSDTLTFDAYFP
ncbi:MAG TPA: NAD(P)/FAD-dependent oxidoreductase, partial [Thermomicrobiales bacterium]|nr:NAD(P)/FAD-dependent oxidoreductase [Thermomicrobiales bacterium]